MSNIDKSKLTSADAVEKKRPRSLMNFFLKAVLLIIGLVVGYLSVKHEEAQKAPTEFAGVKFKMNKEEILYEIGQPNKTIALSDSFVVPAELITNLTFDKTKNHWHYDKKEYSLDVIFDSETNQVNKVICYYAQEFIPVGVSYCKLKNIGLGSSEENVIDNLGNPSKSFVSETGVKHMAYQNINTNIALKRKVVVQMTVTSGASK
jgi:hypothetical protein